MKTILIGLGHRARQGKDFLGEYLHKNIPYKSVIFHFADGLYNECRNTLFKDKYPVVRKDDKYVHFLINPEESEYMALPHNEVMDLVDHMNDLEIDEIAGMEEKDPILLQAWGTNLRRKHFGDDYWVRRLNLDLQAYLSKMPESDDPFFVFIPDTRFNNEIKYIKSTGGYYIEVERYNADGTRYYDPSRNPNHPSEAELDHIVTNPYCDYIIRATSGSVDYLTKVGIETFYDIVSKEAFIPESVLTKQEV